MLVNLTPHDMHFLVDDQEITVPASGTVARCKEFVTQVSEQDGIPLAIMQYGEVDGLPAVKPGTLYIVSALVRLAVPNRHDVASPGELVRDENGRIVGAKSLIVNEV